LLIEPFINCNMDDGRYLVPSPAIIANWEADNGDRRTVPLSGSRHGVELGVLIRLPPV
jgi:hypothetical protein